MTHFVREDKARQIRFDIACKTLNERLANVEMSLNPDRFEPLRLEYYAEMGQLTM